MARVPSERSKVIVQVTGAHGTLGEAVVAELVRQAIIPSTIDVRIEHATVDEVYADVVINCAGRVKQRGGKPEEFLVSNALGPHVLARACTTAGSRLIHVSTDCVFNQPGVHYEHTPPTPDDIYARSKLAGEVTYGNHVTLRCSFVGLHPNWPRPGLISDLSFGKVKASRNLLWSGHTARGVAQALVQLVRRPDIKGLIHLPGEHTNRYELVMALCERFGFSKDNVIDDPTYLADRRLGSVRWEEMGLQLLPPLKEQLVRL